MFFLFILFSFVNAISHKDKTRNTVSALSTHSWQMWFLCCLYFIGAITSLIVIIQLFLSRNKKRKFPRTFVFRFIILIESFVLSFERTCLTFSNPSEKILESDFSLNFLYTMLPLLLQFTTFILFIWFVVLFMYANYGTNELFHKLINPLFLVVVVLAIFLSIISCAEDPDNQFYRFLMHGIIWTIFVLIFTSIGLKFYRDLIHKYNLNAKRRSQIKSFTILVCLTAFVFLIRSVWDIVNAASSSVTDWNESNDTRFLNWFLILYVIFEVLPVYFIVVTFFINLIIEKKLRNKKVDSETISLFSSAKKYPKKRKTKTFDDF
ncbi:tobamovirus multiplication protein 1-like isoform x1 [Anaeramoeba ignava]|uniref:Tobamovirus multiplication protein 1-like isoform x1 n=1 Tax=Anaeramoeba ignava TaxID=1746090 RepID=A0A9Q0LQW6_ANAIG|nr:tobamovirus multiplication protein 1-like isoform x1 [Anaeramoeba ignava]